MVAEILNTVSPIAIFPNPIGLKNLVIITWETNPIPRLITKPIKTTKLAEKKLPLSAFKDVILDHFYPISDKNKTTDVRTYQRSLDYLLISLRLNSSKD